MGRLISKKTVERKNEFDSRQHKSNLRNICGTFAAEGMTISKYTRRNLDRIASGQTSYQQVLAELRAKYEKRGYRGMEIPADAYAQKRMLRSLMNIRRPQAIDAEFLTVQDEYLRQEIKDAGITRLADLEPVCGDFYLWQGDNHPAPVRCHCQRRKQRHDGLLCAVPRLHRQLHPYLCGRTTPIGLR